MPITLIYKACYRTSDVDLVAADSYYENYGGLEFLWGYSCYIPAKASGCFVCERASLCWRATAELAVKLCRLTD